MTFFVVSDIHSFYTPFITALQEAGYEENNPNHHLIVCGDYFDRGNESVKVLEYFTVNKNCTLIRGNHEILLKEAINRGVCLYHDYHNGTALTISDLTESKLLDKVLEFIDSTINYFETKNYIFVHSWIPLAKNYAYYSNWRKASNKSWKTAMWENPFLNALNNLNKTNKTIVFGHWHTSWYRYYLNPTKGEWDKNNFDIIENKDKKIIGIDGCIAYTHKCNVLVIEDEFLDKK